MGDSHSGVTKNIEIIANTSTKSSINRNHDETKNTKEVITKDKTVEEKIESVNVVVKDNTQSKDISVDTKPTISEDWMIDDVGTIESSDDEETDVKINNQGVLEKQR